MDVNPFPFPYHNSTPCNNPHIESHLQIPNQPPQSNQPLSPFPYYSKASGAILKGKTTKNCACLCLANSRAVRHKINIARQVFRQPPRTTQGELERKESRGKSICTSCSAQHKIGCYLRRAAATFKTAQARLGAFNVFSMLNLRRMWSGGD